MWIFSSENDLNATTQTAFRSSRQAVQIKNPPIGGNYPILGISLSAKE